MINVSLYVAEHQVAICHNTRNMNTTASWLLEKPVDLSTATVNQSDHIASFCRISARTFTLLINSDSERAPESNPCVSPFSFGKLSQKSSRPRTADTLGGFVVIENIHSGHSPTALLVSMVRIIFNRLGLSIRVSPSPIISTFPCCAALVHAGSFSPLGSPLRAKLHR